MDAFPLPPTHTKRYQQFTVREMRATESVIVAQDALEMRGNLPVWQELLHNSPERLLLVKDIKRESVVVTRGGGEDYFVPLRDVPMITEVVMQSDVLLDITGLPHNVWAPLLRAAGESGTRTRILYAEPETYRAHPTPASATQFDLTESFEGLAPLPGFVRLSSPEDESKCLFIALLGFEGNRPERLVMQIDPLPAVIPIVGVPGFRIEYPAFTIACNRTLLSEYRAGANLRYVRASCPFSMYEALREIHKDFPGYYMYIAPVGTKPHSVGAILYALKNPTHTEIVFDNPVRKSGRTSGIGVVHIYDFGDFREF